MMASNEHIIDRVCNRTCDRFCFFDQKIAVEKLTGLILLAERLKNSSNLPANDNDKQCNGLNYVSAMDKFICHLCGVDFIDADAMREHFKSDDHIQRIALSLAEQKMVADACHTQTVDAANAISEVDIGSNISNQSKEPSDSYPELGASSHKQMVYFRSRCGEIIGIHRCVLFSRKTIPTTMGELLSCVQRVRQSRRWAVLLYSGGKFAGGIFDGPNEVVHKTLHHYTVRAKQGGGQSSYDASNGGMGGAKSAGASLRRYGEMAIRAEISNLLHNRWRTQLQSCQFILVWSPKVHRNIFFNPPVSSNTENEPTGDSSQLEPDPNAAAACQAGLGMTSDDVRVRRIPCRNNDITYAHVKELHRELSSFYVYDGHANFAFLSQSVRKQLRSLSVSGDDTVLETQSGRMVYGPLSLLSPKSDKLPVTPSDSDDPGSVDSEQSELDEVIANLSTNKAPEPSHNEATTTANKGEEPVIQHSLQNQIEELYSQHHNWHRRLRVAIASGDFVALRNLLPPLCPKTAVESPSSMTQSNAEPINDSFIQSYNSPNSSVPSADICTLLLNYPLAEGRTLLHVAVEFQQEPEVLHLLLENGCDPTLRDAEGKTPYKLATSLRKKQLTSVFRRFRFFYPDRYDYDKAQIPAPLDPHAEAEKAERERERQRKQRQRMKERKAIERARMAKEKEETAEKERFKALSDREKHALVAERRLLAAKVSSDTKPQVFSRCFQCGCDISGKVPFTYSDYNFCTPACLKTHRLSAQRST